MRTTEGLRLIARCCRSVAQWHWNVFIKVRFWWATRDFERPKLIMA